MAKRFKAAKTDDSFDAAQRTPEKNPAAVQLGRRGGQARAAALSADERKRIAEDAARKRWGDTKP